MKNKLAIHSSISAIIFALLDLFLPPQGELSPSVLILVAQFLGIKDYINIIRQK